MNDPDLESDPLTIPEMQSVLKDLVAAVDELSLRLEDMEDRLDQLERAVAKLDDRQ